VILSFITLNWAAKKVVFVGWRLLFLMTFFSSLDRRKEAKEDQGVRDASQFGRVPLSLSFTQQTPQRLNSSTTQQLSKPLNATRG